MGIMNFFRKVKDFNDRAVAGVRAHVPDHVITAGVGLVRRAEETLVDNNGKREWVVRMLMQNGVKEHVARLVVEIAVMLIKKNLV